MDPAIAHLFVTFGSGDDHLAISVEARKDRTKPYATLPGFFRQYELVYIVAAERDVIRVRTNYRTRRPKKSTCSESWVRPRTAAASSSTTCAT
jgi:ribosomal protein L20